MAVVYSKLDKTLPKVSNIRWCKSAGTSMFTGIYTNESRYFTRKVCFKQPSRTDISYQVMYRVRRHYTATVAKTKNAEWTKWSAWVSPYGMSYRNDKGKYVEVKRDYSPPSSKYWLQGNHVYAKNSTYNVFIDWTTENGRGKYVGGDHDKVEYEFQVRTYHAKTETHGEWVKQVLSVWRIATVKDEVLIGANGGGLQIDFNYLNYTNTCSVKVKSITDSNGVNILKKEISKAPTTDTGRMTMPETDAIPWYAYKRTESVANVMTDYTPGELNIQTSELSRNIEFGEVLTVEAQFLTKNNIPTTMKFKNEVGTTPLKEGYVYGLDVKNQIPRPRVETSIDDKGILTIKAYKSAEFDEYYNSPYSAVKLSDISLSTKYYLDDEKKTLSAITKTKYSDHYNSKDSGTELLAEWTVQPPMNLEGTYTVQMKNELKHYSLYHNDEVANPQVKVVFESSGFLFNGITKSDVCVAVPYNTEFKSSVTTESKIELPYGRTLPFAVFGTGRTNTITAKGCCVENEKLINEYSRPRYIKNLVDNLGLYWFRKSNGEILKVAVKKASLDYPREDTVSVSLDMEEVAT